MVDHAQVCGQRGRYSLDRSVPPRGGGQALVYPATSPAGERVAVKLARSPQASRRIAAERDALATLGAQGAAWVVPLLDHGVTADGRVFLVLPWFAHSMGSWLRAHPPLARRLDALQQACEAVIRLHRSTEDLTAVRVHRDIKPDNFLVSEVDGGLRVVLADLGGIKEGRLLDPGTHTVMHTPTYAPPEQSLPLEQAPDPAMDVHALGAMIYRVLTGAPPAAILARPAQLTPGGLRLLQLAGQLRDPDAQEEFDRLRRRGLEELFDLGAAEALTAADEALLQRSLAQLCPQPALAEALAERLLPPLRQALDPDPQRRAGDARKLLAACALCRERLGEGVGAAPRPTPPGAAPGETILVPDSLPSQPRQPTPPPPERASPAPVLLVLLLLLALGGLSVLSVSAAGLAVAVRRSGASPPPPTAVEETAQLPPPAPERSGEGRDEEEEEKDDKKGKKKKKGKKGKRDDDD